MAMQKRVHEAELQPASTVTSEELAVAERTIRLHGQEWWLYGAVDPRGTKSRI
ncbi:Transposase [Halapricum desulfuricans]|uniref:Transposase n=1 Tax=Halapricum desulfuricans TaxID=2841257 RepID=A0A897NQ09_9EURY|nr:Transposase [Halapricum desulfuricans]